ncbi:MAG: O-antigen ligase family protein [Gammaproteobacteria bacterium]
MFTLCAIFFLTWASISVVGEKLEVERAIVALYGILVVAFLLGVPGAAEPDTGFKEWCKFLAYSSGVFFILASLQRVPNGIEHLITGFGVSGLIVLATLYLLLFVHAGDEDFRPNRHMLEDNLPFLTPFILYYLHEQGPRRPAFTVLVLLVAIIGYILLSQGRSALLGLVVALGCYGALVFRWRTLTLVAVASIVMSVLVAGYGNQFVRGAWSRQGVIEAVDDFTSYRSTLWRQALAAPPDNLLTGVGMGNTSRNRSLMSMKIRESAVVAQAKHLHNFLFDAWYETGIIGLMSLLAWLGLMLRRGVRAWRSADGRAQQHAGLFLAASMAILTSALFSFSYRSKPFAIYLFIFLAALAFLDQSRRTVP